MISITFSLTVLHIKVIGKMKTEMKIHREMKKILPSAHYIKKKKLFRGTRPKDSRNHSFNMFVFIDSINKIILLTIVINREFLRTSLFN